MKISLNIIVKDDSELGKLINCVASALPYVSEVHITANGKQVAEIESYCDENKFDYSYLPWSNDFATQRNYNFARVAEDVDYILWLDTDDILVGGEQIVDVATFAKKREIDVIYMTYWYGCKFNSEERNLDTLVDVELYHQRERLIKPNRITWKGRIHETPVNPEGQRFEYKSIIHTPKNPHPVFQVAVLHTDATRENYAENMRRTNRNMELLELELEDERKANKIDPRTILYLMKIYGEMDDPNILRKCIRIGEEYLQLSGWDE
jgi:hypothetical protein